MILLSLKTNPAIAIYTEPDREDTVSATLLEAGYCRIYRDQYFTGMFGSELNLGDVNRNLLSQRPFSLILQRMTKPFLCVSVCLCFKPHNFKKQNTALPVSLTLCYPAQTSISL